MNVTRHKINIYLVGLVAYSRQIIYCRAAVPREGVLMSTLGFDIVNSRGTVTALNWRNWLRAARARLFEAARRDGSTGSQSSYGERLLLVNAHVNHITSMISKGLRRALSLRKHLFLINNIYLFMLSWELYTGWRSLLAILSSGQCIVL